MRPYWNEGLRPPIRMRTIPLTRGQVALVDDEDFERVNALKWCALKAGRKFYAVRGGKGDESGRGKMQYMHIFIMGFKGIDHRDGDGLNNQRRNLRGASAQQNSQSFHCKKAGASSKYRGVTWSKATSNWKAQIMTERINTHLGLFEAEESAARAYDQKARELFGEFAHLNFPDA